MADPLQSYFIGSQSPKTLIGAKSFGRNLGHVTDYLDHEIFLVLPSFSAKCNDIIPKLGHDCLLLRSSNTVFTHHPFI
jgi:hypothetical protein